MTNLERIARAATTEFCCCGNVGCGGAAPADAFSLGYQRAMKDVYQLVLTLPDSHPMMRLLQAHGEWLYSEKEEPKWELKK